ncbi:hypothetical protein B0H11DRAFT_1902810 [Mycena galericulata]|nr:hypothetical protein B0H11DRAFT_1902810 [Mycena galericulata]
MRRAHTALTAFMKLKPKDLLQASAEETRRVPFSNPVVRKLRKHLTSLRSRVPGTDESRMSVRAQIWGMNLRFNPPSIWATINLADTADPIAQVLAGQDIDLDRFVATAGPAREARAINVASDPFAAAEFFHYTINVLLQDVFGIKRNKKGKFIRQPGVLGMVNGYIGTVEAQGRGTLHLHILFWLVGAPSSALMQTALQSEVFREKIVQFIKRTVQADIKGQDSTTIAGTKKKSAVAYSRPEDPRKPNYDLRRHDAEATLARAVQFHDCKTNTCLIVKGGKLVCKRRAPFTLSSEDWVLPSGEWGPRRVCGRLNAWNPALLQIIRANQDIKLITNGHETKNIAFYITLYIAKKQIQCTNASALLAKSLAFQRKMNARARESRDVNRRMITQCANTLSRQQELSGPEVVGYLMGWGDRFISHKFVPIYWDEITGALRRAFPALQKKNVLHRTAVELAETVPPEASEQTEEPSLRLQLHDGVFVLKDQLKEYTDRGHELDDMNFHDYFVDTYHGSLLRGRTREEEESAEEQETGDVGRRRPGRPASHRVPYLPASKRKGCRIMRGPTYETVPQFYGTWFPRGDAGDYYYACMLALLRPWRTLRDLLPPGSTFLGEFNALMTGADERIRRVVNNIAYFHECSDGAKRAQEAALVAPGVVDVNDYIRRDQELSELNDLQIERSEDDVQLARDNRYQYRDWLYAEHAMSVALQTGIFSDTPSTAVGPLREKASLGEMLKFMEWGRKVALMSRAELLKPTNTVEVPLTLSDLNPRVPQPFASAVVEDRPDDTTFTRNAQQQAAVDMLNTEQRRAHDIIEAHARRTLSGVRHEQLLMIVRGEGGTGKTVLLNAIAHTFAYLHAVEALAKTATTGVAASLVGGQTVHSWAGIRPMERQADGEDGPRSKPTHTTSEKRKRNIIPARYLDIDECSMMTKQLLAKLSQIVGEDDIGILRGLLVTEPDTPVPEWDTSPWTNTVLVTPRHAVRTKWNTAAVRKHCATAQQRLYICDAEDTVGRTEESLNLEQRIVVAGMTTKQTGKLSERVELAIGMRAMVITNIATEADLANGTRGEVIDFKLDPREKLDEHQIDPETALSRSRGRDSIRLLRGFELDLFTTHPSEDLAREDDRLDALTEATKRRTVTSASSTGSF